MKGNSKRTDQLHAENFHPVTSNIKRTKEETFFVEAWSSDR